MQHLDKETGLITTTNISSLTDDQREFFVEHGWLRIPNAIDKKYIDRWMAKLWIRLGQDPYDKSTWKNMYLKLPKHNEVAFSEFSPDAWKAMCEIVGGEDRIDTDREYLTGDNFIINFGTAEWKTREYRPQDATGWHIDNDYFRHFLDSSSNALTIINCFTDVRPQGGGTFLAEDGIERIVQILHDHPEGLDPPFGYLFEHCRGLKRYVTAEAKAGDMIITHALLPHAPSRNHMHYARVITNSHINLKEPYNLNRADGNYSLCEQAILRALGKDRVPDYVPTRPRMIYFPRTFTWKRAKIQEELDRMIAAAAAKGLPSSTVESLYLKGADVIREHERRNGYDRPHGPGGICETSQDPVGKAYSARRKLELGL